jgi:hypothetical protein
MKSGHMLKLRAFCILGLTIASARAQASEGISGGADPAAGGSAPAALSMSLVSSIAYDELYDTLKKNPAFASMDKEKLGSPVTIRVSHSYGHTSAGTASTIASAILAGGTLGLLPVFSNRDLVITYDILINETLVSSYSYSKNLTRVFNIHSTDKTHGLGADGLAWVTGTAAQFAADLERDPEYARIQAEYRYYYYVSAPIAGEREPPHGAAIIRPPSWSNPSD